MKKTNLLLVAFLLCSMGVSVVYGVSFKSSASKTTITTPGTYEIKDDGTEDVKIEEVATTETKNEVKDEEKTESKDESKDENSEEENSEEEQNNGLATLPDGTAYVGVYTDLNVRDAVWGSVTGTLYNNDEVTICGRDGDWYQISSPQSGYVHARYIFATKDARYSGSDPSSSNGSSGSSSTSTQDVVIDVDGDSLQGKIVSAAKSIVDKYGNNACDFPYDPLTTGTKLGSLGCAQVATTALVAAGALDQRASSQGLGYASLNCTDTITYLEQKGWKAVDYPPYQAGDVVFWTTYKPGASHVGIVMNSGNSAQAMNNSSSLQRPHYSNITDMTIYKIYRKC